MAGLGPPELIIIVVILLILFGPGKLSGLGSSLGKSIREFRKSATEPDEAEAVEKEAKTASAPVAEPERTEIRRPIVTAADESEKKVG
jgi:sec-independent protein translocase protein TatA